MSQASAEWLSSGKLGINAAGLVFILGEESSLGSQMHGSAAKLDPCTREASGVGVGVHWLDASWLRGSSLFPFLE